MLTPYCFCWTLNNRCNSGLFQFRLSIFSVFLQSSVTNRRRTQKFDKLGINKVDCFIFQGHPQRPSYWIYIVGKCSENAELPKTYSSHSLEEEITVFTALKLSGAAPDDSENLGKIAASFYRYKNWVVFKISGEHSPFLFEDADKQAYLEKHIRKRNQNK